MAHPLPNDVSRCYGVGCEARPSCQRFTTLERDAAFDREHGPRLRSYTAMLREPENETCDHFIEDTK